MNFGTNFSIFDYIWPKVQAQKIWVKKIIKQNTRLKCNKNNKHTEVSTLKLRKKKSQNRYHLNCAGNKKHCEWISEKKKKKKEKNNHTTETCSNFTLNPFLSFLHRYGRNFIRETRKIWRNIITHLISSQQP